MCIHSQDLNVPFYSAATLNHAKLNCSVCQEMLYLMELGEKESHKQGGDIQMGG
jgi:hypothetical protein